MGFGFPLWAKPLLSNQSLPLVCFDTPYADADYGPVGVLLLSVGAPETPDDVEEYLYNVFCDPEIRTLPPALSIACRAVPRRALRPRQAAVAREPAAMPPPPPVLATPA